jgi:hypothetical protein
MKVIRARYQTAAVNNYKCTTQTTGNSIVAKLRVTMASMVQIKKLVSMPENGSSFLANIYKYIPHIPLVAAAEEVGDIQSELTSFLQQIDTTTPSSR